MSLDMGCGDWVLVDYAPISNDTSIVFSSAGDGVRQYPVNGNLDGGYALVSMSVGGAVGGTAEYRLNGGVTNQNMLRLFGTNAFATLLDINTPVFGYAGANDDLNAIIDGVCIIEAPATGQNRMGRNVTIGVGATNRFYGIAVARYVNTATNITSIGVTWSAGIGVSGRAYLFVRNPQTPPIQVAARY